MADAIRSIFSRGHSVVVIQLEDDRKHHAVPFSMIEGYKATSKSNPINDFLSVIRLSFGQNFHRLSRVLIRGNSTRIDLSSHGIWLRPDSPRHVALTWPSS